MTKLLTVLVAAAAVAILATAVATAQNSAEDYVRLHNAARSAVGVGPVSWNPAVARYAQSYATLRAGDCALKLSGGGAAGYGENIYRIGGGGTNQLLGTAEDAVALWVAGEKYYSYVDNSCVAGKENQCVTYTQVVWLNSTSIGCARVVCVGDLGVFIICNYMPAGNIVGERPY